MSDPNFDVIEDVLGPVAVELFLDGLPEGRRSKECGYDEKLVEDVAHSCREWLKRKEAIKGDKR